MSITMEYLIAFVAILLIPVCFYVIKTYRVARFYKKFPSPSNTKFFSGNAQDFRDTAGILPKFHEYRKECGNLVHLRMGPIGHRLLCSDAKFLEFLLGSNKVLKKSANIKFLGPWLGEGLVAADGGPKWKMHRKLLTPAFHFKILEQFVDIFEANGNILVEKLSKMDGSKSLDIYPYITLCALDAICETAMDIKMNVQNTGSSSYFEGVKEMCRIFALRTVSVFIRSDFIFSFTQDYKVQQKAVNILHNFTNDVILRKRKQLEAKRQEKNDNDIDDLGRRKKKVFLDLILEATVDGQGLSDVEIREEVDTFMFGGHDTTATAISYILYCIANHKEVQDKIFMEQEQIFGSNLKDAKVTYAHLQEMKYLENVIKETLRLYPSVPFFGRELDQDVEYDGEIIPKGVRVIIFVQGVHMSPEYYSDPEKFDPDRWENTEGRSSYTYIPFSAGARNCIGQKYAIVELKTLVSKIVRNFELFPASPKHELIFTAEIVMKPLNGIKIGLKRRQTQ